MGGASSEERKGERQRYRVLRYFRRPDDVRVYYLTSAEKGENEIFINAEAFFKYNLGDHDVPVQPTGCRRRIDWVRSTN